MSHSTTSGRKRSATASPDGPLSATCDLVARELQHRLQALGGVDVVLDHQHAQLRGGGRARPGLADAGRRVVDRQLDRDRSTLARPGARDAHPPLVQVDQALDQGQPEAEAAAGALDRGGPPG